MSCHCAGLSRAEVDQLKTLPLFETLSGNFISIDEGESFLLDSHVATLSGQAASAIGAGTGVGSGSGSGASASASGDAAGVSAHTDGLDVVAAAIAAAGFGHAAAAGARAGVSAPRTATSAAPDAMTDHFLKVHAPLRSLYEVSLCSSWRASATCAV